MNGIMLGKQVATINLPSRNPVAARAREVARGDARVDARTATICVIATISGHRRCGFADSEQRVGLCLMPELKMRYVPRAPQRAVSIKEVA